MKLRTSWMKSAVIVGGHGASRVLPTSVLRFSFRRIVGLTRRLYHLPGNPFRKACEDVTVVARARGLEHQPRAIHDRMLSQFDLIGPSFIDVFYEGRDTARDLFAFEPSDLATVRGVLAEYGGAVLAVPHNVASLIAALGLEFNGVETLVVVRNRKGDQHNEIARQAFERMGIDAMMTRSTSSMDVSRRCLRALSSGKLLIATLDYRYRQPNAVSVPIFGIERGFAPWAAHFAARRKVPVVPCYPYARDGRVGARVDEPLVHDQVERLVEHYVRYFESCILEDPGSWAFLFDKHWRRHIRAARARLGSSQGEVLTAS